MVEGVGNILYIFYRRPIVFHAGNFLNQKGFLRKEFGFLKVHISLELEGGNQFVNSRIRFIL